MRCQYHSLGGCQARNLVDFVEEADVGIQICHGHPIAFEQVTEQPRFHRRGELGYVVHRRHPLEAIESDLIGSDDLEWLAGGVDGPVGIVDQKHRARFTTVVLSI